MNFFFKIAVKWEKRRDEERKTSGQNDAAALGALTNYVFGNLQGFFCFSFVHCAFEWFKRNHFFFGFFSVLEMWIYLAYSRKQLVWIKLKLNSFCSKTYSKVEFTTFIKYEQLMKWPFAISDFLVLFREGHHSQSNALCSWLFCVRRTRSIGRLT